MKYLNVPVFLILALMLAIAAPGCETSQRTNNEPMMEDDDAPQPMVQRGWPSRSGGGMVWTNMAYPTGNASTSVVGIEKGMPAEVRLNQPFDYVIAVTNLTTNELQDVVLIDSPDDDLVINSSRPSARDGAEGMTWALGDFGPRETKVVRINATATAEGEVGGCTSVAYNALLCATVPVVSPELRLVKTGPARVLRCDSIEYTFVVTNTGTGSVSNVTINDPLPSGLEAADGSSRLTFNVGDLAPGQSKTVKGVVSATQTGTFENAATASGSGLTAESGSVETLVVAPELEIEQECPDRQYINRNINSEITVSNTGDGEARDTVIQNTMPANATFVSASDGGQLINGRIVWNLGTLAPDTSRSVTFAIRPNQPGTFTNRAAASAFCADNVNDTCSTVVTGIPAILLEVVDLEDPGQVGTNTTYLITVTNQGSADDTNIIIRGIVEENQEHVSNAGATRGTVRGETVTFAPIPTLAPGEKATFRVTVRNVKIGDVRFTVTMDSDQLTREVRETEATRVYE